MTSIPTNFSFMNDRVKFRYLEKLDVSPEIPDRKAQVTADKLILRRNRMTRQATNVDKLQAATGALIGTAIPMLLMMKKQGLKNP